VSDIQKNVGMEVCYIVNASNCLTDVEKGEICEKILHGIHFSVEFNKSEDFSWQKQDSYLVSFVGFFGWSKPYFEN